MDIATIRTLCTKWLTLSDAMALRCVSRDWRETLHEKDDTLWDNLVDITHGEETATALRHNLALRGWQLVQKIHREEEQDNNATLSSLKPEDVTCLIEISYRTTSNESGRRQRKINLTSFLVENVFSPRYEQRIIKPSKPLITVPNPFYNKTDAERKTMVDRFMRTHLEIRATFLRSDTQQTSSLVLQHRYGDQTFFSDDDDNVQALFEANVWKSPPCYYLDANFLWKREVRPTPTTSSKHHNDPTATFSLTDTHPHFSIEAPADDFTLVDSLPHIMIVMEKLQWTQ